MPHGGGSNAQRSPEQAPKGKNGQCQDDTVRGPATLFRWGGAKHENAPTGLVR